MIGVDLVSVVEFQRQMKLGGECFLHRAFGEMNLSDRRTASLAGLWAAKEAIAKAADVMPAKITNVRIRYDGTGRPYGDVGGQRFGVSIAHHGDYVVAVALAIDS
jgi:NAD(P)H-hydrate epimerase